MGTACQAAPCTWGNQETLRPPWRLSDILRAPRVYLNKALHGQDITVMNKQRRPQGDGPRGGGACVGPSCRARPSRPLARPPSRGGNESRGPAVRARRSRTTQPEPERVAREGPAAPAPRCPSWWHTSPISAATAELQALPPTLCAQTDLPTCVQVCAHSTCVGVHVCVQVHVHTCGCVQVCSHSACVFVCMCMDMCGYVQLTACTQYTY